MLNEKQLMAIDMLIEGKYSKTDIAKSCGKSRQWLYESVINNEEAKAEADRKLHEIKSDGLNRIKSNLGQQIDNIIALSNNAESDKIKLDANIYLVNRILGGITTKIADVSEETEKESENVDLGNEFSRYKDLKKAE